MEVAVDPRLSTLLDRKARLRETTTAHGAKRPAREAPEAPPPAVAEQLAGGRVGAETTPAEAELPTFASQPAAKPPAAAAGKAAETPPPSEEDEAGFTARLLEAKKRALRRDKK